MKRTKANITDSDRLALIKKCFLEERDKEAVEHLRALDESLDRPSRERIWKVAGINSRYGVSAGASEYCTFRTQVMFQPKWFMVNHHAESFLIDSIRVGVYCQTPSPDSIAASLFACRFPDSFKPELDENGFWTVRLNQPAYEVMGLPFDMSILTPGVELAVCVTNISGMAVPFRGAILGLVSNH